MPRLHVAGAMALALAMAACTGPRLADSMAPTSGAAVFGSGSDDYGLPPVLPQRGGAEPAAAPVTVPDPVSAPAPSRAPAPVIAPTPIAPVRAPRAVVNRFDHPAPPPPGFTPTAWDGEGDAPEIVEETPIVVDDAPIIEDAPITLEEDVVLDAPAEGPRMPLVYQGAPEGWSAPCGSPCAQNACCCPGHYIEFGPEVLPGLGFGFNFGWRFKQTCNVTWAAEIGASYQDLWEEFIGEGLSSKYWGMRLGLKAEFGSCNSCVRWFAKGGIKLFELAQPRDGFPGDPDFAGQENLGDLIAFDRRGSCLGVYAGFGFDWKIGRNWTIGPEVGYFIGENLSRGGEANRSPYFRLNIAYNF